MKKTPTIEKGLGTLIITGSSGRIGSAFIDRIGETYTELRSGPGNLNKPLSGESATVDGPTGRCKGAENDKENETDALSGVQSSSGVGRDERRQDARRTRTAV